MRIFAKYQAIVAIIVFSLIYFVLADRVFDVAAFHDFGLHYPVILAQCTYFVSALFFILLCPKPIESFGFRRVNSSLSLKDYFPVLILQLFPIIGLIVALFGGGSFVIRAPQTSIWVVVVTYLILSPIAEEILFRGLIQSLLDPLLNYHIKVFKLKLSVPVVASALLFGLTHVFFFRFKSPDFFVVRDLALATALGLICGYLREKYQSLIPAIYAHSLFSFLGIFLFKVVSNFTIP